MKILKRVLIGVLCVGAVACLGGLYMLRRSNRALSASRTDAEAGLTVTWQEEEIEGTYEGELSGGVPSGEGTFTSTDGSFVYTGSWKKGMFNGDGTIVRNDDGTEETGVYKSGRRNGFCLTTYSDGSYATALYESDVICGNYHRYNSEGEQEENTRYLYGEVLEDYAAQASELTAEMIRAGEAGDGAVYVDGVVTFVYQNTSTIYYRMETENVGVIVGKAANAAGGGASQAYIPNLKEGDAVRLYGTYGGYLTNTIQKDTEYYGYNFPTINADYVVLQNNTYTQLSTYRQLTRLPFDVYADPVSQSFTVKRVKRTGEKFLIFAVSEYDSNENHEYLLWCKTSLDETFLTGTVLHVEGYYDGQYKVTYEADGEEDGEPTVTDADEDEAENEASSAEAEAGEISEATGLVTYPRIRVLSYSVE